MMFQKIMYVRGLVVVVFAAILVPVTAPFLSWQHYMSIIAIVSTGGIAAVLSGILLFGSIPWYF